MGLTEVNNELRSNKHPSSSREEFPADILKPKISRKHTQVALVEKKPPTDIEKLTQLANKHRALLAELPKEAQKFLGTRVPMRIALQFFKDLDSVADSISALPKESKDKMTQSKAMQGLLGLHITAHALIRSAVAEEIINDLPNDLDLDQRAKIETKLIEQRWNEKSEHVSECVQGYITALTTNKNPPHLAKELGGLLKDIQSQISKSGGRYISDPQEIEVLKERFAKITGRKAESFLFPPTGVNMPIAVNMVQDIVSTEYLVDRLSLCYFLGNKGSKLPSWSTIESKLKKQFSGLRTTERDKLTAGIVSTLKRYDNLAERRDEILRISKRQVSDTRGWDIYVPFWHIHYMWNSGLTTDKHKEKEPTALNINKSFTSFKTSVEERGRAWAVISRDRSLQAGVESLIIGRGAYLLDPSKTGQFNSDARNYQRGFVGQRKNLLEQIKK